MTEFYRNYLAVAVLMFVAIGWWCSMLGVGRLVRPSRPQAEKYISYEAGSDPTGAFGQSNVRYYVFACSSSCSTWRRCSSSRGR